MLYLLFKYLNQIFDIPGGRLFNYISFRSILAIITSLLISLILGKFLIKYFKRKQIGETVRELNLEGQTNKQGTPTMGGIIIILSLLISVFLYCNITNIYIIILTVTTIWLAILGFIDDYIKIFKKNKEGINWKIKLLAQGLIGLFIGITFYLHPKIVIREKIKDETTLIKEAEETSYKYSRQVIALSNDQKNFKTTLPFLKNNEFDYQWFLFFLDKKNQEKFTWIIFVLIITFIIAAVSNGANLTDGLDGLAASTSAIIVANLAIFAYVSGNIILAHYLNIMYIPYTGELVVFSAGLIGALIGFLWYNSFPAQIFMGDTGSLTIGGIIACYAILIRKEVLLPLICGIFLIESLSVLIQVGYFKYTKKKYGEGKRIFLMAPLHHHYQKKGLHEVKIVMRFIIIGFICAALSIITLKIR